MTSQKKTSKVMDNSLIMILLIETTLYLIWGILLLVKEKDVNIELGSMWKLKNSNDNIKYIVNSAGHEIIVSKCIGSIKSKYNMNYKKHVFLDLFEPCGTELILE